MAKADKEHFESYRLQTRIKHAILESYLPAYFDVIKKYHRNLLFIDGFAGPGHYQSESTQHPGSPLRALRIIAAKKEFAERVLCVLIEKDPNYFAELKRTVSEFYSENANIKEPIMLHGTFAESIDGLLESVDGDGGLAPTFLFVDPCGVEDVSMKRISSILSRKYCEVFVFFNLDGIRRIMGLAGNTGKTSPALVDLFGSKDAADQVVADFVAAATPLAREAVIVRSYRPALANASGAEFILPLRVESEQRVTTSHYLLHATKHPRGFKIMKQVMWSRHDSIECEGDALALLQASREKGAQLFRPDLDELHAAILSELSDGPKSVRVFRDEWVCRPDDMFSESVYRETLLALEEDGKIEVLEEDGRTVFPATQRRPYRGRPSLVERLFVRLSPGEES